MDVGSLIREVRQAAGLTQATLASRAAVSQSNVAAYEASRVSPSITTLERLLRAAGARPVITTEEAPISDLSGPIGHLVRHRRKAIRDILSEYGVARAWIFGSTARGDDRIDSDLDLLVALPRPTLVTLAALSRRLSQALGVEVDVAVVRMLRDDVADQVTRERVPL